MTWAAAESDLRPAEAHPARDAMAWLRQRLRTIPDGQLTMLQIPGPDAPAERLLELRGSEDAVLWCPPTGEEFAGLGSAQVFEGRGDARFDEVRLAASERLSGLVQEDQNGSGPTARVFGGFAFQGGRSQQIPWTKLGDGRFVLPELRYARAKGRGYLALTLTGPPSREREAELLDRVERARSWLAQLTPEPDLEPCLPTRVHELSPDSWRELVEDVVSRIDAGQTDKIVAARRTQFELPRPRVGAPVLARLRDEAPRCTRFSFFHKGTEFLGATPERLVLLRGDHVITEALAGTFAAGSAARLLDSSKDLGEHAIVVQEIARCLWPWCSSLDYPERPDVRELRHVVHLFTPFRGTLTRRAHVLELVRDLHPTPAVGGVPRKAACEWIVQNEPEERGWYAGPVGWFDAEGDGEFCVALRSGVLLDRDAYLFAGAGIVHDSKPDSEYAETRLKLRALSSALGIATDSAE